MLVIERQRVILEHLRRKGVVSTRELASALGSPEVTIRRDLIAMARSGLVNRTRGGAVVPRGLKQTDAIHSLWPPSSAEDVAIAALAAKLIHPGDSIVLGRGSATLALAFELVDASDLMVVTNSLLIAEALQNAPGIDLFVTGGSLRRSTMALVGPSAEQSLRGLRATMAFLSGDGLTARHGLSTTSFGGASEDRAVAAAANRVIALIDHRRIGRDALCQIVPCAEVHTVITSSRADADELQEIKEAGVAIQIVVIEDPDLRDTFGSRSSRRHS